MKVYLVKQEGEVYYKIGYLRKQKIQSRIKQLQTSSPVKLELVCEYESNYSSLLERVLHQKFKQYKQEGEWFILPESEVLSFKNTCLSIDNNFKLLDKEENSYFRKIIGKK